MSTVTPTPAEHPAWCARRHAPEWRCHTADIGEIETGTTIIDVDVAQYAPGLASVVSIALHEYEETRVVDLSPDRARRLGDLLTEAADVLDGHCLPRGAYDRGEPVTGAPLPPGIEGYAPGQPSGGAA